MALDPSLVDRVEKPGREVKSGRGSGDGAFLARIDGLVVGAVAFILGAFGGAVGWQRNMSDGMDGLVEHRPRQVEGKGDFAALAFFLDRAFELAEQAAGAVM